MTKDAFIARHGGIYEDSPWVAAGAWDLGARPGDTPGIARAMRTVVEQSDHATRLRLLRAHPDLAGKLALAGDLTRASRSEQQGAGLDRLSPDELATFQALNAAYTGKHGFPFIFAVKGADKHAILAAFRTRLTNDTETEFHTALDQVHRIAGFRLAALEDHT